MLENTSELTGTPSRMYSGALLRFNDDTPRSLMLTVLCGSPEVLKIWRPATFPCNASPMLDDGLEAMSFDETVVTEPTILPIFWPEP